MNIALIGFMGTGKTTTGKILADKMKMEFIETDDMIEESTGKSIPQIFDENGEEAFREIERLVINELSQKKNLVISCGGGVATNEDNVKKLKNNSTIVLLTAKESNVIKRVTGESNRPLLNTKNWKKRVQELMEKRKPIYEKACDIRVNTDNKKPEEIAEKIVSKVKNKK